MNYTDAQKEEFCKIFGYTTDDITEVSVGVNSDGDQEVKINSFHLDRLDTPKVTHPDLAVYSCVEQAYGPDGWRTFHIYVRKLTPEEQGALEVFAATLQQPNHTIQ